MAPNCFRLSASHTSDDDSFESQVDASGGPGEEARTTSRPAQPGGAIGVVGVKCSEKMGIRSTNGRGAYHVNIIFQYISQPMLILLMVS